MSVVTINAFMVKTMVTVASQPWRKIGTMQSIFSLFNQHVHLITYKVTIISVRVCEIITQQKQKRKVVFVAFIFIKVVN